MMLTAVLDPDQTSAGRNKRDGLRLAGGSRPTSRIDDRHRLDLDHEIGTGEAGDADSRAGRSRHAEIAHAYITALLEFVKVGHERVGLDDIGPGRAGGFQAAVEVLERLLHLD